MKILIIALSGIGDALMFTPALKLLKANLPESQIDALVMYTFAKEIFANNPNIGKTHHFNFLTENKINSLNFILGLRNKYDVSILVYPSNRKEYNLISYLINAKQRVAARYLRRSRQNLDFLNNLSVIENDSVHNVQTNIKLVEALLGRKLNDEAQLELFLTKEETSFADEFFRTTGIDQSQTVIGFHPGCATLKNHIKRRWEPEKFSELGKRLIEKCKSKILIFGGPDEQELKQNISDKINSGNVIVIDTKSILQSAAIMKRCNVFVTNDSSQMHIASALGLKVIAIIGPTNKHYIHPWKTQYEIVSLNLECSPCFFYSPKPLICSRTDVKFKCIKELTVDMVYEKVLKFI
jgi:heptosyltransferase-2